MDVPDRYNWALSGLVGVGLIANGVVVLPGETATIDLVIAGVLITGGLLATGNAVVGFRDPDSVDEGYWTMRKTAVNVVALALLVVLLAVDVSSLV